MDGDECACGRAQRLTWSPLWGEFLCPECLWQRTETLLKEPVTILPVPAADAADGALASGGYLAAGTAAIVGEHGPCG